MEDNTPQHPKSIINLCITVFLAAGSFYLAYIVEYLNARLMNQPINGAMQISMYL